VVAKRNRPGRNIGPRKDVSSQRAETARQKRALPKAKPMAKRTGAETGPGTYVAPRRAEGGALRAQGRAVAGAQRELTKQKNKLGSMQPNAYKKPKAVVKPPNKPKKPKKKQGKSKFGPNAGGGTMTMPGYWEV
jgi:hypothetical protein